MVLGSRAQVLFRGAVALVVLMIVAGGAAFYFEPLWVNDQMICWRLGRAGVESKYVMADGYTLHYFEARPKHGEGKPLVLVHGLGSRGEDWSPMIPTLVAAGFHVYVPDLLGYGRSDKPDVDYSIGLEAKTVKGFMGALGLKNADVGGWSLGGWVALKLTVDDPALVDRLVIYDSAGIYFPTTFESSLFVPTDSPGLAKLSAQLTPKPKPLPGFVSRAAIARLQANGWVIRRAVASMEKGHDLMDFKLAGIAKPTLIVWGQQDELIPLAVGEQMHAQIPGSSLLVVAGCGHLAPAECSKPVLRGTVEFLRAEPAIRGGETMVPGAAQ